MKFFIRDLLWLIVVVALAVGWWVDRQQLVNEVLRNQREVRAYGDLAKHVEEYRERPGEREAIFEELKALLNVGPGTYKDFKSRKQPLPNSSAPATNPPKAQQ